MDGERRGGKGKEERREEGKGEGGGEVGIEVTAGRRGRCPKVLLFMKQTGPPEWANNYVDSNCTPKISSRLSNLVVCPWQPLGLLVSVPAG